MTQGNGDFSIGNDVWPGTGKLVEEMAELQQVLGKLIGSHGDPNHFDGTDLRERLIEEIADVKAAIDFFQAQNFNAKDDDRIQERQGEKLRRFSGWHGPKGTTR